MYAKVFASVFEGSMRGKPDVLLVWFNILAHAPYGVCDRTHQTIADEVGISLERVRAAIGVLESPDLQSRSPEFEGRRLLRLSDHRDWGWKLVNWEFYRSLINECDRRAKDSERQRNHRKANAKHSESHSQVVDHLGVSRSVTPCHALSQNVTFPNASASVLVPPEDGGTGGRNGKAAESVPAEPVRSGGDILKFQERVSQLYDRRGRPWNYDEEYALAEVAKFPHFESELDELIAWRERLPSEEKKWFPQSIKSLLQNWNTHLDKARTYARPTNSRYGAVGTKWKSTPKDNPDLPGV